MMIQPGQDLVEYAKIVYAVALLIYFSFLDIRDRSIPDKLIWSSLLLSGVFFALSLYIYIQVYPLTLLMFYFILSIIIGPGLFALMYFLGKMGGADVIVVADLALLFSFPALSPIFSIYTDVENIFPPVLVIIFYSTILFALIVPVRVMYLWIRHRDKLPKELPLYKRVLILVTGTPITVGEFLEKKHYYPLTIYEEENGVLKKKWRTGFDIEEEYTEHQERVRRLIEKGLLSYREYIWVTYGVPFIVPLTVGLIVFLLIGDWPLRIVFGIVFR